MTRPNVMVGALAAVCVGTLLWCAWLILAADLTLGTSVAAWGLWLLVAAAAVTLVAYVRELGRHRHAVTSGGSWKPLPSLVLVWIGGLTAVGVFAFMLPSGAAQSTSKPTAEARPTGTPTTSSATLVGTGAPRVSSSTASRSKPRTTPTTSPTAATATSPAGTPRPQATSTSPSSTSRTSTTTSTPSSTTKTNKPGITITLPHKP